MLDAFLRLAREPSAEKELRAEVANHVTAVRASAKRGDRSLVRQAEAAVRADPGVFSFDASGHATLKAAGHAWSAGRFEAASLGDLRARTKARKERLFAEKKPASPPRARLFLVDGQGPATDIGAMQASAGDASLFQVASQYNCLESPGPFITPVERYLSDPTQGPRASVSAFPGTLLRHYAAPGKDGERFVQVSDGPQIELLGDVCPEAIARAQNGYLMDDSIHDTAAFFAAIHDEFDAIKVGVHEGVEVVLGYDWDGAVLGGQRRTIAQVLTSTVAGGSYGGEALGAMFEPICRVLQRAAYLGTLLAAASLGKTRVVLTLIGGGVFSNPVAVIWEAIQVALAEVEPLLAEDLDVIVNGRDLISRFPKATLMAAVRARNGAAMMFDRAGNVTFER
ncbi:MAG: hypothetical protein U0441_34510 [Polyangiaceae bacterium]